MERYGRSNVLANTSTEKTTLTSALAHIAVCEIIDQLDFYKETQQIDKSINIIHYDSLRKDINRLLQKYIVKNQIKK